MVDWRPSSSNKIRLARAQLYQQIRQFFIDRQFLEVDPPLLGQAAATDPHLHSLPTHANNTDLFLQTSPEFFMKRLLADGSGPIFALCKSFRDGEQGRFHNPEFTLLEWYQPNFDDVALMGQVGELIDVLFQAPTETISYRDLFIQHTELNPHTCDIEALKNYGKKALSADWETNEKDLWLDAIFSQCIQPNIQAFTCVFDYPASQAALAQIKNNNQGELIAKRFEVFANGIELGNGYWELRDAQEQAKRFNVDNKKRSEKDLPKMPVDKHLIAALTSGLPNCAGIAFGIDRLLMLKTGADSIEDVMDFPFQQL